MPSQVCPSLLCTLVQAVFKQRKNAMFRRAAELSALSDCDVAVIVFGANGELSQFASTDMESILKRYSAACTQHHERQSGSTLRRRQAPGRGGAGRASGSLAADAAAGHHLNGSTHDALPMASEEDADTVDAMLAMQSVPSLSPRSTGAYEHIDREFDKLIESRVKRAKRAQAAGAQAAAGGASQGTDSGEERPGGAATLASPTAATADTLTKREGTEEGVIGPQGGSDVAPDPAAPAAAGPASAFDFMAAALAGNADMVPPRPRPAAPAVMPAVDGDAVEGAVVGSLGEAVTAAEAALQPPEIAAP